MASDVLNSLPAHNRKTQDIQYVITSKHLIHQANIKTNKAISCASHVDMGQGHIFFIMDTNTGSPIFNSKCEHDLTSITFVTKLNQNDS